MVPTRLLLFSGIQALFAAGYALAGSPNAWEAGAAWWPYVVGLTNLIVMLLLIRLFLAEGKNFWDLYKFEKAHAKKDMLALLGIMLIAGPVSFLPNILVANWLFGDAQIASEMMFRHLPAWAAYASLLVFPVSQGLVELPTYFGYSMPRLEAQTGSKWLAVLLPALFLGAQHMAVPLLFDARFMLWRLLMFLPFAMLMGIVLRWRPRLLPYLVVIHILMDVSAAVFLIGA
jgi:hypothetical protein